LHIDGDAIDRERAAEIGVGNCGMVAIRHDGSPTLWAAIIGADNVVAIDLMPLS
jgi:hypothetical protein